jgi:hypothetical protein
MVSTILELEDLMILTSFCYFFMITRIALGDGPSSFRVLSPKLVVGGSKKTLGTDEHRSNPENRIPASSQLIPKHDKSIKVR